MRLIKFASSYTYDSGANSIEKQMSGGIYAVGNGGYESVKGENDRKSKDSMSKELNDIEKEELLRYRSKLAKRVKEKGEKSKRKLNKRLDKYKTPLPMRILEDRAREKSIESGEVSPLI